MCVCDFIDVLEITQSKAFRHLRHLFNAGLVDDRRERTWVYFRIAEKPALDQIHLFGVLPILLEDRIPPELFQRLENWSLAKAGVEGSCRELLAERAAERGGKK